MPEMPPPILLSAIICDRAIFDHITGMPTLVNLIQVINAPKYPTRAPMLVFFCELTNGRGSRELKVKLVESHHEEKVLFEKSSKVNFKDVKQIMTVTLNLQGVVFPAPGEYRFQVYIDGSPLGERRIVCKQVQKQKSDPRKG